MDFGQINIKLTYIHSHIGYIINLSIWNKHKKYVTFNFDIIYKFYNFWRIQQ